MDGLISRILSFIFAWECYGRFSPNCRYKCTISIQLISKEFLMEENIQLTDILNIRQDTAHEKYNIYNLPQNLIIKIKKINNFNEVRFYENS